ncbi:NAD(P)H-binding protein [Allobranchiibius sp. GilTou38]|uniref:NAD(P)H-binding protein n=1 Tax=Allobranchiibius sp. GilTou38 TaxID=2815210 RepID=UPI001AA1D13C|nr:NAD(P)H-binding protein [Allobranchiibius sp. GilTou38]MBO1768011.1 NAD(P)H-binding protein [Allobranchiibius sp. GilTou38]
MTSRIALVTGATGYIGGLLVPKLLESGWQVRVLSRHPEALRAREWSDRVEVAQGSASDPDDMKQALDGVDTAYYLLHSMDGGGDFVRRDREMAHVVAEAAHSASVRRLVYLSGLHPTGHLSPHLGSRVEVGEILLASGVPTAVLQAGVVLGDGSASFDMLRHLTERLPAVVAPRWLRNRIQPVAIDDVLHYLVGAADLAPDVNRTFDVGGPDVLTYAEMMREYARVTGLGSPLIATVPVLTPQLASHWVGAVTPVSAGIARPLVGSLVHEAVCHEDDILEVVGAPPGGRTSYDDAIQAATAGFDPQGWRHQAYQVLGGVVGVAGIGAIAAGLARRKS